MATRISQALGIAACNAEVDSIDTGSGTAVVEIRTGAQPAGPDSTATGTLLASINLPNPAFGNAADAGSSTYAEATSNGGTLTDSSADNTGTAGHFRIKNRNGTAVIDGTITLTGGGGQLELDNLSINAGQQVSITGIAHRVPYST